MGKVFRASMVILSLAAAARSQTSTVQLPKPDSAGWIKLWRGDNPQDFFTYYSPTSSNNAFPDNTFKFSKDTIVVSGTPTGHIMFKQSFSHYRIRFEQMEPTKIGNCGMIVHVQMGDPVLFGSFPRSIECQGDPTQGIGQVWCISSVWVSVHAKTGSGAPRYDPTAPLITYGAKDDNSRQILGVKEPAEALNEWVLVEAEVHGSDSLAHFVRGETMIKYSNPHVGPANNPNQVDKVLKSGLVAWQSEGVPVRYRNIYIKLFKEDPLYASLYGTTGIADYRILPKAGVKPALRMEAGVLSVVRGSQALTLTGQALPVKGL
ncbi:MAG: DUF1080 domain-containing protein [Fibrobacteres bacterium]|nr:DUF1080 domain-containing protein [Fibrobacterota bacterium]